MKLRKADSTHACFYCYAFYNMEEYIALDRTSDGCEICNFCCIDSITSINPEKTTLELEQELIDKNDRCFGTLSSTGEAASDLPYTDYYFEDEEDEYADEYYHTSMEKFTKKRTDF